MGTRKEVALILVYAACQTCRNALKWLEKEGIAVKVRPIVDEPPTPAELKTWIAASGMGVRKWLNTSGQSYRALGKAKVDAASDAEIITWLAADGRLVKRPVLVRGSLVLLGFNSGTYEALLR